MLSIVILCDINKNVNIYDHEDMFGILNTPTKWGLDLFSQFSKIKIRTNIIIFESFSSNQNCTHALYRINVIPIKNYKVAYLSIPTTTNNKQDN